MRRGMTEEVEHYSTPGLKGVLAESIEDAAALLAERRARLELGQRGQCRKCTCCASTQDGNFAEFSAIIVRSGGRSLNRSVRFTVYRTAALDKFLASLIIDENGNLQIKR
jgi:hypothetical protein